MNITYSCKLCKKSFDNPFDCQQHTQTCGANDVKTIDVRVSKIRCNITHDVISFESYVIKNLRESDKADCYYTDDDEFMCLEKTLLDSFEEHTDFDCFTIYYYIPESPDALEHSKQRLKEKFLDALFARVYKMRTIHDEILKKDLSEFST